MEWAQERMGRKKLENAHTNYNALGMIPTERLKWMTQELVGRIAGKSRWDLTHK